MKSILTTAISAVIGLSVLAASLSTPANAGKRERRVATGIAIGAATGLIIASELNRRAKKAHFRDRAGKRKYKRERRIRRDRYFRDKRFRHRYDRWNYSDRPYRGERYRSYRHNYYPDYYSDDYERDYQPRRTVKKARKISKSKQRLSHIQRCKKAYRSYDPQSDTYLGYDGREHVCRK